MEIGLQIQSDRNIDLRFEKFPEAARVNLLEAINQSTTELYEAILDVVPRRTGKLAASIQKRVVQTDQSITGIVGVTADFGKAGALEYGSHKTITMKLSHVFSHLIATIDVQRTLNLDPQDFLRGPEQRISSAAFDAMQKAVQEAIDA